MKGVLKTIFIFCYRYDFCCKFSRHNYGVNDNLGIFTGQFNPLLQSSWWILLNLFWPAWWGGAKLSDVLKLAGVDHCSNVTPQKGRHVEFVSVDFCKVSSEFSIFDGLIAFMKDFQSLDKVSAFSVANSIQQLETGSIVPKSIAQGADITCEVIVLRRHIRSCSSTQDSLALGQKYYASTSYCLVETSRFEEYL